MFNVRGSRRKGKPRDIHLLASLPAMLSCGQRSFGKWYTLCTLEIVGIVDSTALVIHWSKQIPTTRLAIVAIQSLDVVQTPIIFAIEYSNLISFCLFRSFPIQFSTFATRQPDHHPAKSPIHLVSEAR